MSKSISKAVLDESKNISYMLIDKNRENLTNGV